MNYSETLDYLFSRLPMYQRVGPAAYKNNLDNTLQLDNFYGNPHRHFKTIHVAGTNGKGSVSHMLAAILQSAGYKTGLYTSPHLKDFRERIRIDGKMIPENEVVNWVENYKVNDELQKIEPSFFELTVAMAFDYFANEKVDIAIVEVGLGGRLDSTNIITPEVSIITNIGLDHTALLGDSLEAIAKEKAGIIKNKIPVVIGTTQNETQQVFTEKAGELYAPLYFADREYSVRYAMNDFDGNQLLAVEKNGKQIYRHLKLDLKGAYQQKNLPAVLKTLEFLKTKGWGISQENIETGLAEVSKLTGLLGRWQVLDVNPRIVCDTAHNADGLTEIVKQLEQTPYKKLHVVFGMVNDKEPEKILKLLPQNAAYYFTKANIPRALDENVLAKYAAGFGLKGQAFSDVNDAYNEAKKSAGKDDFIFVGGSTFIVAEIL
ncbi:dihydrofolate synthase / folylpolyglutamate synthase [Tangfeifania diversioriginum]|uniref:Dihydrofolate synthase/folylpolyglutamate synthase n=1 Tax=Tangfeifania diversioriginum TaxID=1168035 RepID=A0A1M6DK33_9BACT|nr:folylpolyglutamate synthase/dihydrofolate synthase family protein [Tangfeifania diversioriginum]SHI73606.1 dihydrofolate synthase / folylpolyglutamate synthase [Tangfeifania diversioriginum]